MAECINKAVRKQINQLADSFEDAWISGKRPEISDYFDIHLDFAAQQELFKALIELEIDYCKKNDIAFNPTPIVEKFSQHASLISTIGGDEAMVATAAVSMHSSVRIDSECSSNSSPSDTKSETALVPGQSFGRYQILSILGQGAMGAVYLAEDGKLHRKVALKVPRFQPECTEQELRFLRESKMAAAVQHPNICPIFDVGVHDGIHYICMGFIQGESLAERLKSRGPLDGEEVARVVCQLASALQDAHHQGVVHRDLKPANVMINHKGDPIVTDFGLARQQMDNQVAQLTHSGMILGSPAYMSPEQIENSAAAGPSCDIYSLGIMMYQLLTGELPFRGDLLSLISKIASQTPALPSKIRPDIHPELEAICLKAIEKRPESRFRSMSDFATALQHYRDSCSPSTSPIPHAMAVVPIPAATQQTAPASLAAAKGSGTRWSLRAAVLIGAAALGYWLLNSVFWIQQKDGFIRVEINDPLISVVLTKEGISVNGDQPAQSIRVEPGIEQGLRITRGDFVFETKSFVLKDGETTQIKIDYVAGELIAVRDGSRLPSTELSTEPTAEHTAQTTAGLHATAGNALAEQQRDQLNRLLAGGVRLLKGQNEDLPMPIEKQQIGIWGIDTTGHPKIMDADLDLLLQVVPSCIRLAVNSDFLETAGWQLIADYDCTELMLVGKSPDADAWALLGSKTELTAFEPRFYDLKDSDLLATSGLVNIQYMGMMFTPITGSSLSSLANYQQLQNLDLMGATIRDEHLAKLGEIRSLRNLGLNETPINGSGLKGLRNIVNLNLGDCPNVSDLSALESLPLTTLYLTGTSVRDISPLKKLKLTEIYIDYDPKRDREVLLSIPTLQYINGQPARSILQE